MSIHCGTFGWKKIQVVIVVTFSLIDYCHKFEFVLELIIPK
jgi:hypothetical protein